MPSPKAIMRTLLAMAALIFANGVAEATPVNPQIQAAILTHVEQRRRDPRFGMRRKEMHGAIFGIGLTRMMTLEAHGEVQTYLDGASRMITVDCVYHPSNRAVCSWRIRSRQGAESALAGEALPKAPAASGPRKNFSPASAPTIARHRSRLSQRRAAAESQPPAFELSGPHGPGLKGRCMTGG